VLAGPYQALRVLVVVVVLGEQQVRPHLVMLVRREGYTVAAVV